jgi:hypothetical protein
LLLINLIDFLASKMYKKDIMLSQSELPPRSGERSGTLSEPTPPPYEITFAVALAGTVGSQILPPHRWPDVVRKFQSQCPGVLTGVRIIDLVRTMREVGIVKQHPDSGCWTVSPEFAEGVRNSFEADLPSEPIAVLAGMLRAPQER